MFERWQARGWWGISCFITPVTGVFVCMQNPNLHKDMSLHKMNFNQLEMGGSSTVQMEDFIISSWLSRLATLSDWWLVN